METRFEDARTIDTSQIELPAGYRIEPLLTGLTFPTSIAFDDAGWIYIAEGGYSYGAVRTEGRILRLEEGGSLSVVAGNLRGPVTGIVYHEGGLYVAEGGYPPRISRVGLDGSITPVVEGLLGPGDHFTNGPAIGSDGWLYFGQGSYTNSAVVGEDNFHFGWLQLQPEGHDVPGYDVTLAGRNYQSFNPLSLDPKRPVLTGAFSPLGTTTSPGQQIKGRVPCTAGVMRCRLDGSGLEVFAWGLRNPFALRIIPDGRLLCIDQGYDDRGSRPVGNAPDPLYELRQGAWYGWPDFVAGEPASDPKYRPENSLSAEPLLSNPPPAERPLALFPPHAAAMKFDIDPDDPGRLYVAEFGAGAPIVAPVPGIEAGRRVSIVDLSSGSVQPFATNRSRDAAFRGGLERPIEVRFDPSGRDLYVVDFAILDTTYGPGVRPFGRTGVIWRISKGGM